jgi:hypothetical protein
VPRRIFGPKRERKLKEAAEKSIIRSFIICSLHQILLGPLNKKKKKRERETHGACTVQIRNKYKSVVGKPLWEETTWET